MLERRLLVIGSQCAIRRNDLTFLPKTAEDFYRAMTDPERGACQPALADGGLLLDPDVAHATRAIQRAYLDAGRAGAMLVLAYIGHGDMVKDDFYLLPKDGDSPPLEGTSGVNLVQIVKNLMGSGQPPAGLLVLLDACYAGIAAEGASKSWVNIVPGAPGFEMIAAVADRPAFGGCFTSTLCDVISKGLDGNDAPELLRGQDVIETLRQRCKAQFPQLPSFNPHRELFLARNVAWDESRRLPTQTAAEVDRLTKGFQPTQTLRLLVDAITHERAVAVVGPMGCGKSTLVAALARPRLTQGVVPRRFLHALAIATMGTTPEGLAKELSTQLDRTLEGFKSAAQLADADADAPAADKVSAFERRLLAPLRRVAPTPVRIAIDGLDQLSTGTLGAMIPALEALARDDSLAHVRLVVTSLPDTRMPASLYRLEPKPPTSREIKAYLKAREIRGNWLNVITTNAHNNWLVAQVLADNAAIFGMVSRVPAGLSTIYDGRLRVVRAQVGDTRWDQEIRPVLEVLAVAGTGPIVPMPLLVEAVQRHTKRPMSPATIAAALAALRGFVVHQPAGDDNDVEVAGVFHATVRDYLDDRVFRFIQLDEQGVTRAIVDALRTLAPRAIRRADDPLYRYAVAREAELCWEIEDYDGLVHSLRVRQFAVPRDTFAALRGWHRRLKTRLADDDNRLITLRGHIARVSGEAGHMQSALRLLEQLQSQQTQQLGERHRDTLWLRSQVAHWTGRVGRPPEARALFESLLPLRRDALGEEDRDTLDTRGEIAHWTGMSGGSQNAAAARLVFQTLAADYARIFGDEDGDTLTVRANLAHWTGQSGDAAAALALVRALLPVQTRVFGPLHLETLRGRNNEAFYLGRVGESAKRAQDLIEARDRLRVLYNDAEATLGRNHDFTVQVEMNRARLTGEAGDPAEALRLTTDCLERVTRVFGAQHVLTRSVRRLIAQWTLACGDAAGALALLTALEADAIAANASEVELSRMRETADDARSRLQDAARTSGVR